MVSLSSIMVTKNDGSSPTSVCVDPVATNYKTSGPTCKYKPVPAGKTGLVIKMKNKTIKKFLYII